MSEAERKAVVSRHSVSSLFVFFLIGLFAVLAVTLTLVGVRAYRSVSDASVNNSEGQIALSYLLNKVHSGDQEGGVQLKTLNGQQVLCLRETVEEQVFETRIYFAAGALREYYALEEEEFDPEMGEPIATLQGLSMEMTQPWLLKAQAVQPDGKQQEISVALRAGEERK